MKNSVYDFVARQFKYHEGLSPERNLAYLKFCEADAYLKPSFTEVATSDAITGTRTSDTVFTRTTGTFTVDALIGKIAIAFVSTDATAFSFHQIADNDASTVTIATTYGDAALFTGATRILIFDTMEDAQLAANFIKV